MRTAHLFAGAGGGILADLILGHEPVVAVEWDAYACQVLRERFPGLRVIEGDVRDVDFARELAGIDALCAGFPCQDISAAGRGAGIKGERSGLYREVMRAIDAVRPGWVFLENSPLIRTRGRHIVIADLVARGYTWRDGQLAAADVGAAHIRNRWWCLARRADADGLWQQQPEGSDCEERRRPGDLGAHVDDPQRERCNTRRDHHDGDDWHVAGATGQHASSVAHTDSKPCEQGRPDYPAQESPGRHADRGGECSDDLAHTSGERLALWDHQRSNCQQEQQASAGGRHVAQPEHSGCEGWHAQVGQRGAGAAVSPSWWGTEPGMGRVADGVAHRTHRIKALGNGQVPLQAAAAWVALGGPWGGC